MFFSFVSFITNCGFFLTCLENVVYDDVLWRHDDFEDDVGIFFNILILVVEGRGVRAEENQNPEQDLALFCISWAFQEWWN